MNIIDKGLKFTNELPTFNREPSLLILHHEAASSATVEEIHDYHIRHNGWSGIAYHLYVRKDGKVYVGRPINKVGGHCKGYNSDSIGICCEGNFEVEQMSQTQYNALREAVAYVRSVYPGIEIKGHRELNATACPGKNFPLDKIRSDAMSKIPDWAREEYGEAQALGITDGTRPNDSATRLEVAIMILRAIKILKGDKSNAN